MSKPFEPQHLLVNIMPEARTELSTLLGALSLLKPELEKPSQLQMLAGAETAAHQLLGLLQKFTDLGALNHNQLETNRKPAHVAKLLHRLVLLYSERALTKGVEIEVEVAPCVASMLLDEQKLYRVLANIMDYALASARPGVLRITAGVKDEHLAITLIDTGPGVAAADIFSFVAMQDSPQWKSRGVSGSLQLGVYLGRQMLRLMGGDLGTQVEPGAGPAWSLTLPAESLAAEPDQLDQLNFAQQIHHAEREIALSKAQDQPLLLADDSPSNRLVLAQMLRKAGHTVDAVNDGLEVLAALKEREYAAVLLDLAMPRMDGLTASKRIRELPSEVKDIPLIALTAHTSDRDKERVYSAGFDAYLTKPVSAVVLKKTLQRVITKSTKATMLERVHDERLSELNRVMGPEKLKLLLGQFAGELVLYQQPHGVSQSGDKVLDLPLLARTARTFGFSDLAAAADRVRSEIMQSDVSEITELLNPAAKLSDQGQIYGPGISSLMQQIDKVGSAVQAYISTKLSNGS